MLHTLNKSIRKAILRAYFEGLALDEIADIFDIKYTNVIIIIHNYLVNRKI